MPKEFKHEWTEEDFEEMQADANIRQLFLENEHPFTALAKKIENPKYLAQIKEKMLALCEVIQANDISCLFFLDKSARPAAWMFRQFWKEMFPERTLPAVRFLNYGREKNGQVSEEDVLEVRNTFTIPESGNIGVVDEFTWSKTSLLSATRLIQQAYPDRMVLSHDLGITDFVSFPARYKAVKDKAKNSNSSSSESQLISERQPDLSASFALRSLVRKMVEKILKMPKK